MAVLPLVRLWSVLKLVKLTVKKDAFVTTDTSSADVDVFPSPSAAASMENATIASAKCFFQVESVKNNANAKMMAR